MATTSPYSGRPGGVGTPVVVVKLDNTPSAQPHVGLTKADVVYVEPAPTPRTVKVVKKAPTAAPTSQATAPPIVVHRVVRTSGGEHEDGSEHEGGDD